MGLWLGLFMGWFTGLAPEVVGLGGQPVPDNQTEIAWLLDAPWAKVALMITLAVIVLMAANALMRKRGRRNLKRQPDFDLRVAKLEALPVTAIAQAKPGAVHLIGTLRLGNEALGTGEHACVFQNRVGSTRSTAIAAELVLLADDTGVIGLDQLDGARVIAPKQDARSHEIIALYLGDKVEVVGELMGFDQPQTVGGEQLRGMLGSLGQIQVRVVERPTHAEPAPTVNNTPPQAEHPAVDSDPFPDYETP